MSSSRKFIVIEGIDRSGKTSICKAISEKLNVKRVSFPNRLSVTGEIIDKYLQSKISLNAQTIHLLFSANRWEMQDELFEKKCDGEIQKNLKETCVEGECKSADCFEEKDSVSNDASIVLCDRYYFSGIAYTAAKGVDLDWCKGPDSTILEPDLVVFIDVTPEMAMKRPGFGGEKYEKFEYQTRVYGILKGLVEEHKSGIVVDGNKTVDEIADLIVEKIMILC